MEDRGALLTEARNPRSASIDRLDIGDAFEVIAAEDATVPGAVAAAKSVELPAEADLTLTQAVASCGGFDPDADRAHVRVTRRRSREKPSVIVVDASRIAEGLAP